MSTDPVPPREGAVQHQVRFKLDELKKLSFELLAALPRVSSTYIRFGDFEAKLVTHRETQPDGRLLIVVQFWPKGTEESFVWRGVYAEGFWLSPSGEITVLPDRLRHAYM